MTNESPNQQSQQTKHKDTATPNNEDLRTFTLSCQHYKGTGISPAGFVGLIIGSVAMITSIVSVTYQLTSKPLNKKISELEIEMQDIKLKNDNLTNVSRNYKSESQTTAPVSHIDNAPETTPPSNNIQKTEEEPIHSFDSHTQKLELVSGDTEFKGHDPSVHVIVSLRAAGTKVYADLICSMREAGRPGGGNTVARLSKSLLIKDVGKEIKNIVGIPLVSEFEWVDRNSRPLVKSFDNRKNFKNLTIVADGDGPDVGHHSSIQFWLHEFRVEVYE